MQLIMKQMYILENELVCYYCGHEEGEKECGPDDFGRGVSCQMDDPRLIYYGDSCYVGHSGILVSLIIPNFDTRLPIT
jgi:hypothetical protein